MIAGLVSYEWGHTGESRLVKVIPASPEMMEVLRDEHGLIAGANMHLPGRQVDFGATGRREVVRQREGDIALQLAYRCDQGAG